MSPSVRRTNAKQPPDLGPIDQLGWGIMKDSMRQFFERGEKL
jgi:hypothetical protein